MVVYLYAPYQISQNLVDKKSKRSYTDKKRDIHERNAKFLSEVEREYLNLAKNNPEWRTIVCTEGDKLLSVQEISEKIFSVIEGNQKSSPKKVVSSARLF
ncbi:MAG: hypothetical protein BWY43_00040 [candidate division WS2 bacterium ADurb.Bin280]|uniref:Thymidylate kinase n=1 Tax=candidate division WS2 bacterium ADurb.Bin280 TaxID=1852829 RepID=A0A1V5SFE8_9BACT|nr:MAG: hypothetical protein BWY43_00040 [candidate division WS2 bacterium ADurb.Bin280]